MSVMLLSCVVLVSDAVYSIMCPFLEDRAGVAGIRFMEFASNRILRGEKYTPRYNASTAAATVSCLGEKEERLELLIHAVFCIKVKVKIC